MNSQFKYTQDYNEAMAEDPTGTMKFIADERKKALNSYPKGEKVKYCSICNEPLVFNSVSYGEEYHVDNCI